MKTNIIKSEHDKVDIEAWWFQDQLFIKFVRAENKDLLLKFDDIDLEHFISTLILLQR